MFSNFQAQEGRKSRKLTRELFRYEMDDLFSRRRSVENIILMFLLVVNSRYSSVCNNWSWLTARKLLCKMCVHGSFKSFALLLTTTLLYENRFVVQNFALLQQFEPQSTKSSPFFLLRNCNTHNHKIQLNLAWLIFLSTSSCHFSVKICLYFHVSCF